MQLDGIEMLVCVILHPHRQSICYTAWIEYLNSTLFSPAKHSNNWFQNYVLSHNF